MSQVGVDGGTGSGRNLPALKLLDCTLRVSAVPLSVTSIWLTVTDHQSNDTFGKLESGDLLGLKYMVLIISYLMVTSGAAAMEIIYLMYKGNREVTWSEACSSYGKFCSRLWIGVVLHCLALCCFLSLSVISGFRAFSHFGPPCVSSSSKEQEVEQQQ